MSNSVVYYSHTWYDVNGSFGAVKCDIWSPEACHWRSKRWVSKRKLHNVAMAWNVNLNLASNWPLLKIVNRACMVSVISELLVFLLLNSECLNGLSLAGLFCTCPKWELVFSVKDYELFKFVVFLICIVTFLINVRQMWSFVDSLQCTLFAVSYTHLTLPTNREV